MTSVSRTPSREALAIWQKYVSRYNGEIQGCCPLIADEIQRAIGGEVVAGYLTLIRRIAAPLALVG
jgi:hypothetical protein